ncbi:cytosolic sulfotransferase 15-like [Ziziphus jujuba]|uniref:Sulfotransferase n=1 Tax=Ziziphus jujuba TaxID=326968 RepID=A0ABM3ID64_ZIZJJ|nr:cytosolic sulfotransferase 15-like [Ziziphus jujuba]
MEKNRNSQSFSSSTSEEDYKNGIEKLLNILPRKNSSGIPLCQYNGIGCPSSAIHGMIPFHQFFQANQNDIILASLPKSGMTWLKALIFSIVNRNRYALKDSPLLTTHPHDLVFSVKNPLDNFVSYWHFSRATKNVNIKPGPIDESFVNYCAGYHGRREEGLVEEISRLCSFEHLNSLEANKNDVFNRGIPVTAYFRKSEVGDYANHPTPSMVELISKVIEEKFANSGLVFKSN